MKIANISIKADDTVPMNEIRVYQALEHIATIIVDKESSEPPVSPFWRRLCECGREIEFDRATKTAGCGACGWSKSWDLV